MVQSPLIDQQGHPAQYFEKGRVEDLRQVTDDPLWRIAYGRLTAELMEQAPHVAVNQTSVTYGDLWGYTADQHAAPPGFTGGTLPIAGGVFIPAHSQLGAAPGYIVPLVFWEYINRGDLFANGWLHAIGLPLTNAFEVRVTHAGTQHVITMQAFERAVLTYNPHNPPAWQVERGNIGTDAWLAAGQIPLMHTPPAPRYMFPIINAACSYGPDHHTYPATDIFCPIGSEFVAVTDGVVDFVSRVDEWDPTTNRPEQRSGLAVAIIGDDGWRYYGSHLLSVTDGIEPGVRVSVGQSLGKLGRSGNARHTPPHVHFGISRPTTPDDWQVRRGEIWPYEYLRAWERGEMLTPLERKAQNG
jgi:Membrane proteins related to metalloendopeptidases